MTGWVALRAWPHQRSKRGWRCIADHKRSHVCALVPKWWHPIRLLDRWAR